MQKLDELGVLDSTIIYISSDMGNPALHSTRNVPTVIAGGANGAFRMGRRLKVAADCPAASPWCAENDAVFEGVTNNHILVSIANVLGVDINEFGQQPDMKHKTGALAGACLSELEARQPASPPEPLLASSAAAPHAPVVEIGDHDGG